MSTNLITDDVLNCFMDELDDAKNRLTSLQRAKLIYYLVARCYDEAQDKILEDAILGTLQKRIDDNDDINLPSDYHVSLLREGLRNQINDLLCNND